MSSQLSLRGGVLLCLLIALCNDVQHNAFCQRYAILKAAHLPLCKHDWELYCTKDHKSRNQEGIGRRDDARLVTKAIGKAGGMSPGQ